jgi:hypothetical protein
MDHPRVNKSDARSVSQDPRAHRLDVGLVTLIVTGLGTLALIVHW